MSFRIETFCKIFSKSTNSSFSSNSLQKPALSVHQNKLLAVSDSNGGDHAKNTREWHFARVFPADQKNRSDLYSSACGKSIQYFLNGFNSSLLLIGGAECLLRILKDNKGPLSYLTEHLSNLATKQFKNLKQASQVSIKTFSSQVGSLPYLKFKNDVEMAVYQLDNNGVVDLSNKKISVLDAEPCIEHDLITGCVVRNLNMFSLVSNSSKECCKNFQSIAAGIDLEALQSSLVVIEFNMTKILQPSFPPATCWLRIVLISTDENNLPFKLLPKLLEIDPFEKNILGSLHIMENFLSDLICSNCVTKSISFLDSLELDEITEQSLNLSVMLNKSCCTPVQSTPFLKSFLSKYVKLIKRLDNQIKKNRETKDAACDDLKTQLSRLDQSYRVLHEEKEQLTQKLMYAQNKLQQVTSENQKESAAKVTETADKLKMTKEVVDLKLQSNLLQQNAIKQIQELKAKLEEEHATSSKFERDLMFEQKVNMDLKSRFQAEKKEKSHLQEEFLELKVKFHRLKEESEDHKSYVQEQEQAISTLLTGEQTIKGELNRVNVQREKELNDRLEGILATISPRGQNNVIKMEESVDVNNHLQKIEKLLTSLKREVLDKTSEVKELKVKLLENVTYFESVETEHSLCKNQLQKCKETLESRSKEYEDRLKAYISNIKEFLSNNNNLPLPTKKLETLTQVMSDEYQQLHQQKLTALRRETENVHRENTTLALKCRKVMVAYRQTLDLKKSLSADIDQLLPTEKDVDLFQMRKEVELKERLKITENQLERLQAKLHAIENAQCSQMELSDALEHHEKLQSRSDQENAELHERLMICEQDFNAYKMMKQDEVASLHEELFRLRLMIGMKDSPLMMHSPPLPPEARLYPNSHRALPPLHQERDYWKGARR